MKKRYLENGDGKSWGFLRGIMTVPSRMYGRRLSSTENPGELKGGGLSHDWQWKWTGQSMFLCLSPLNRDSLRVVKLRQVAIDIHVLS